MKPLFIFSLPRSGSTLLQRMLSISDKISTASEPWILLPILYTLKSDGAISEYWHHLMVAAVKDFYEGFPNQKDDYFDEIQKFVLNLYAKRTEPGSSYFLDKTPRYHLICKEIIQLFPEGKFIFLWRNPLAIISSIMTTWTNEKWKLSFHRIDLMYGLFNLIETYNICTDKVHSLQYENLIQNPAHEVRLICNYLDIEYDDSMISSFADVRFHGSMGDKTGINKYRDLNLKSINAWQSTFDNPYRRYWASRYLKYIGEQRLLTMGYEKQKIKEQLMCSRSIKIKRVILDLSRTLLYNILSIFSVLKKNRKKQSWYFYN